MRSSTPLLSHVIGHTRGSAEADHCASGSAYCTGAIGATPKARPNSLTQNDNKYAIWSTCNVWTRRRQSSRRNAIINLSVQVKNEYVRISQALTSGHQTRPSRLQTLSQSVARTDRGNYVSRVGKKKRRRRKYPKNIMTV